MSALMISIAGPSQPVRVAPSAAPRRPQASAAFRRPQASAALRWPQASAALRLTRRGRLVFLGIPALLTAAVVALVALALLLGTVASPANAAVTGTRVNLADYASTVTVLQGESLWSLAAASDPGRDVRAVVSEIVALNGLSTGVIQAGQQLYVPRPK
ncbi:LysM peptidoglycan-binding domain-containing protein [Specibacter sp. RAF43]|uniref:LysM peptidoglycan-binding domain-containing protein n=1 Tax=Specibacter sp. RAF43 TaxID=3233057 RepID=UPI003F94335F